jgi:HEAT repeat protein
VDGLVNFEQANGWVKGLFALACSLVVALSLIPAAYVYRIERARDRDPGNAQFLLLLSGLWFFFGLIPAFFVCGLMWFASPPISVLLCTLLLIWLGPIFLSWIFACIIAAAFWCVDVPNRWRLRHGLLGPTDEEVAWRIRNLERARAVTLLTAALKHDDARSRRGAAEALGRTADARAVVPLIDALKDKDWVVRANSAQALGKLRDARAVIPVCELLKDGQPEVRRPAAGALGEIGHPDAVSPLIEALNDQELSVSSEAAAVLGKMRDTRAVFPLIETLKHQDALMRRRAAEALGTIADDRAVSPLFEALKSASQSSATGRDEDFMFASVAEALRNIGEPAVLVLVEQEGRQSQRLGRLISDLARRDLLVEKMGAEAAFEDIRKIGTSAVLFLVDALKDEGGDVRSGAAVGLGIVRDARGVLPLCDALKDQEPDVRRNAAHALGEIRDAHGVLPLVEALNDGNWSVRSEAAQALGNIGDPGAVTALSGALKDSDSDVRRSAARALNKLGDARALPVLEAEEERCRKRVRDVVGRPEEPAEGLWTLLKGLLTYVLRG